MGSDKTKPLLAQELNCKTISAFKPVLKLLPTPMYTLVEGEKFKLTPQDRQKHVVLAAKNLECQVPNLDTSHETV